MADAISTSASAAGISIPGAGPSIPPASPRRSSSSISARGSTRPRSTRPITARCRRRPSRNGRRACPTASSSRSRRRASAPTASMLGEAGGIDRQVLRAGLHRARRQVGPDPVAAGADQEVRRRRASRLPDAAADQPRRHRAAPCARGPARELPMPRVRRAGPRVERRDRLRRSRDLSRDRRSHRRLRLCAAAAGAGRRSRRAIRPAALDRWAEVARGWAAGREPGRARLCQRRAGAERSRARSSPSSSAATRSAIRPPPKRLKQLG